MDKKLQIFMGIMFFYAILACLLGPLAFYYLVNKSFKTAGYGFIAGSILSIILWLSYGKKMV